MKKAGVWRVFIWRGVTVIALFTGWEVLARQLNPLLYVPPSKVLPVLVRIVRLEAFPTLPEHLGLTLWEILAAYALAVLTGLGLGFVLGLPRHVGEIYEPIALGALRDPERRLVPVADALLRPRPRLEDRLRCAARLLPRGAGRPGRDPRRGPASPDRRARPRGRPGAASSRSSCRRSRRRSGRSPGGARAHRRRRDRRRGPRGARRARLPDQHA